MDQESSTKSIVRPDAEPFSALPVVSDPREDSWAERAEHWITNQPKPRIWSNQRRNLRAPLVLTGHGISFRVNHGALEVKNGFTHYPQKQEEWRFFRGDQARPSRILLVDGDGKITLDVLAWLSEQDIPLIQLDYRGRVVTAIGSIGPTSADPKLTRAQAAAASDPKRRMAIANWLIREKLSRSASVLRDLIPASPGRDMAIAAIEAEARKLERRPAKSVEDLLGVEGTGAKLYFAQWQGMPLNWKDIKRHPIPREWHQIGPRSSARRRNSNRFATHPVNAMLNYAYAALEGQLRMALIGAGFDISVGFLHSLGRSRVPLLLDLLEPCRTIADRVVLKVVREEIFSPGDFTITSDGVVRLHPQLARRVVGLMSMNDEIQPVLMHYARWLATD
jgi:CRISPR-associated endonuclease Cas1